MDKESTKNIIYGGLRELVLDHRYYYHSSVGPEYCHFTDIGVNAVKSFIAQMALNIHKVEEADLDRRAKEMVIKGLKGESV